MQTLSFDDGTKPVIHRKNILFEILFFLGIVIYPVILLGYLYTDGFIDYIQKGDKATIISVVIMLVFTLIPIAGLMLSRKKKQAFIPAIIIFISPIYFFCLTVIPFMISLLVNGPSSF